MPTSAAPPEAARDDAAAVKTALSWTHTARFLTTASALSQLPVSELPEIAFVGRSNAGKSTAINTLTQQKRLAFASKTPGRTQHINLFELGPKLAPDALFADLPGYGYAAVERNAKLRWQEVMASYLDVRRSLSAIVVLVDSRLGFTDMDKKLLGFVAPRVANGSVRLLTLLTKVDKAFGELVKLGLVDADSASPYRVFGAQATGCSPIATAYENGWDAVRPVKPNTIAKSLAIGNPADGPYALDVVRRTGGAMGHVSDAEVIEGIQLLASTEGVFAETAGGVTVATLRKLLAEGLIDPDEETVLYNTGDGLKTIEATAVTSIPTVTIAPSYTAFVKSGQGS